MAKSFKKFRDEWDDDEWGSNDEFRSKDRNLENRRSKRRKKVQDRFSNLEDDDDGDGGRE